MKGLTLIQPYASLIAWGHKTIETRSWGTTYRGPIAVHAGRLTEEAAYGVIDEDLFAPYYRARGIVMVGDLPWGAIVAIAELAGCVRFRSGFAASIEERSLGDFTPGRFGWLLSSVIALPTPIPCRGMTGLWPVPAAILERLQAPS